ncbi:hypothetical protein CDL12_01054 [Handroanthus impetiginosus]|uniref:Uncharacterized protein n=1 Tax=Handroanthus impetiginosus TaxID=429701 RepID=A0A2G9I8X4_9LAMI|nr:hypothetical protein CDL12_01054 [Handroanthus impetiginosus]
MEIVGRRGGEKLESQNLRDFLRIKEEDRHNKLNQSTSSSNVGGRNNPSGLTLNAVLSLKRGPPPPADEPLQRVQSNRTLLDIIREDQSSGLGEGRRDGRSSWRLLRDKIRLRRRDSGSAWSSTVAIPASDVHLNNSNNNHITMMTRRPSLRFNSILHSGESPQPEGNTNRVPERDSGRIEQPHSLPRRRLISEISETNHREDEEEEERSAGTVEEEAAATEQPARMSLMALLAETDRQMGVEGSAYMMDEEEEDEEEEEDNSGGSRGAVVNGGEYNN